MVDAEKLSTAPATTRCVGTSTSSSSTSKANWWPPLAAAQSLGEEIMAFAKASDPTLNSWIHQKGAFGRLFSSPWQQVNVTRHSTCHRPRGSPRGRPIAQAHRCRSLPSIPHLKGQTRTSRRRRGRIVVVRVGVGASHHLARPVVVGGGRVKIQSPGWCTPTLRIHRTRHRRPRR